jgi:hypothetical protein
VVEKEASASGQFDQSASLRGESRFAAKRSQQLRSKICLHVADTADNDTPSWRSFTLTRDRV